MPDFMCLSGYFMVNRLVESPAEDLELIYMCKNKVLHFYTDNKPPNLCFACITQQFAEFGLFLKYHFSNRMYS